MIIVFLLLFRSSAQSESDDYDVRKANQFLHKLPSSQIERLFTVGPLEKEVRLDFDADSREKMHNEVRRSVPEVRLEGHEDRTIPLNELTRMKKRFIRSAGSAFDQPVYDFMIPAGQQENSSLMAVLKFSTPDTAVVRFSVQMDRYKWFEITEVKRTQIGGKYEYEVPLSQAPNVDIEPERTKNSVYKFMVEAKQGKEVYNSRVRVEILSFSPTAEKVKATIEGMSNETTTVGEVEGSLEEPLDLSIGSDLPLTITATTDKSTEMNQETTEMVRSSSSQVAKEELEGSGEEPNRERTSLEQEEEDPLSEVVTVSTLIQQKETIKGNEINVTGTHEGVFDVDTPLNRGDLIRGLVISATSKSEATSWLNISIDRPELFSVRPRRIESGGKAYLFCNHPELIGDVEVKIMVSDGPVAEEQVVKIKYNRPTEDHLSSMALDFTVPEDAPSGTIIGRIANGTDMKVVGKSGLFALIGNNLLLSCPSENPCLDYETQHVHYLLLLSKDGSLYTTKVFIQVEDRNDNSARIETTDHVLRLSDGQLLMPFAIQILDEDTPSTQQNELSTAGDASDFLQLDKIDVDLYQVQVRGSPPPPGRYELVLRVDDGVHHSKKTHKTVKVLVQNSHSHAHFRRETRYERNMTPEEIVEGEEMLRVELEGLPIDEAKFVILSGNPGWLKIDDYGGAVRFSEAYSIPVAGRYETVVAVLSRKTGLILTQTVVTTVLVTNKEKKVFERELYEKTIDREAELIEFVLETGSPLDIDRSTIMAIDENGMQQQVEQGVISIHGDKIIVDKKSAAKLRVVRMEIRSGMEKAIVVLSLVSSNSFLDQKRRMASKPVFPAVPDVLEVVEELPIGHVLVTVPAVDPETGNSLSVIKRDDGQGLFALDPATGALTVTKRMDYDTSTVNKEIGLTFESGDGNYKTVTKMLVRLVDSDDNPPQINRESLPGKIVVPENIPVNTVILRVPVIDLDETSMKEGLVVTLSGTSKTLFKTMITNRTLVVQVAKELDRETKELHVLHLTVEDHAAHKDSITVNIELSDVNDSTPKFTREVYDVQAVEDWPAGVTLETVRAVDADSMERGQVVYSLLAHNSRHFTINKTSGELQVSQDLMGLAREEPYVLTAVATDKGVPVLNTTVPIRITVSEPRKHSNALISFISPPLGHVLTLNRELSPNEKIYQTKARIDGDGRNLKYSLKELLTAESLFDIDEMTGEVIVKKPLKHKEDHCLLLTARTLLSGLEESRLLRIRYSPFSRPDPVFPHGKPLYFPFRKQNVLGSVHITVEEIGAVFYYLIPSCSPSTGMFSLNATSGELSHIGLGSPKNARIELCILATRQPLSETASLVYNSQKTNNILVDIVTEDEEHSPPDLQSINNTITVLDRKMSTVRLEMDDTALVSSFNFSIGNISFIPSESVLPLTTAAPLASLFTISRGGIVRPSSSLSSQPAGVYTVHVQSTNQQGLFQEFHLIPPSARLRFIFDKQLITVAKEFSAFEKELKSTVSQSTDSTSRLFLDQPKRLPANTSRSSICFHAVGVDTLLSAQTTIKSLSKNGDLLQVYNKFGVVDIVANCEDSKVVVETMAVALSSPTSLIAVSVLAFSSLIFFMIFVYFCFVRRYRDYLRLKGKALKEAPPVVPPTPTFVLSPPNSSPHFGYWE